MLLTFSSELNMTKTGLLIIEYAGTTTAQLFNKPLLIFFLCTPASNARGGEGSINNCEMDVLDSYGTLTF